MSTSTGAASGAYETPHGEKIKRKLNQFSDDHMFSLQEIENIVKEVLNEAADSKLQGMTLVSDNPFKENVKKPEGTNDKEHYEGINVKFGKNEDWRIKATENNLLSLEFDRITDAQRDQQQHYVKAGDNALSAGNGTAAHDSEIGEQMLGDEEQRQEDMARRPTANVYGSDVEILHQNSSRSPTIANKGKKGALRENKKFKKLKFTDKVFYNKKDVLVEISRLPNKYKKDDHVFFLEDSRSNIYKVRWEGNSKSGVGVILQENRQTDLKQNEEKMIHLFESLDVNKPTKNTVRTNVNEDFTLFFSDLKNKK